MERFMQTRRLNLKVDSPELKSKLGSDMSEQQQKSDWEDREYGALWKKTSKSGTEYYGGKIGDQAVIIFANKKREEGSKQPHLQVYKDTRPPLKQEGQQQQQQQPQQQQQQPQQQQQQNVEEDVFM